MSSTPRISNGLNKFTPDLFARMGNAIEIAERSNFGDQLQGFKVWPSFWATIIGFCWDNNTAPPKPRFRRYIYLWEGGGFSSGLDPQDPEFSPAVNLAELRLEDEPPTFLGINLERLKNSGLRQMPYITSEGAIVDDEGELTVGLGPKTEADGFFFGGTGPTVRMYLMELDTANRINPVTGEPYNFSQSTGVYAFSATPNFDGPCEP